jgi:hypothetical protein
LPKTWNWPDEEATMTHVSWAIDGGIVAIYLVATMAAGIVVRKYVGKVEDFLVCGRGSGDGRRIAPQAEPAGTRLERPPDGYTDHGIVGRHGDRILIGEHFLWWLLTMACVVWYSTITVYVAIRGAADIREMLTHLGGQAKDRNSTTQ